MLRKSFARRTDMLRGMVTLTLAVAMHSAAAQQFEVGKTQSPQDRASTIIDSNVDNGCEQYRKAFSLLQPNQQRLLLAIRDADVSEVERLLQQGLDPNFTVAIGG